LPGYIIAYSSCWTADTRNIITIDVEEWYQTVLFYDRYQNVGQSSALEANILEILSFLKEHKTAATFFIVGSVAEKYPDLIRLIADEGHEIASHWYLHRLVYRISIDEFRKDVEKSIDILAKITGKTILGYRAPTWSITQRMPQAISVLESLGLKYDSSIYPVGIDREPFRHFFYRIKNNLIEVPPSTFKFYGVRFPFAGGTFLRIASHNFVKNKILALNSRHSPAMVYFHSWEFDNTIPCDNAGSLHKLIQYGNYKSVKSKFRMLLRDFQFSTIREILMSEDIAHG